MLQTFWDTLYFTVLQSALLSCWPRPGRSGGQGLEELKLKELSSNSSLKRTRLQNDPVFVSFSEIQPPAPLVHGKPSLSGLRFGLVFAGWYSDTGGRST